MKGNRKLLSVNLRETIEIVSALNIIRLIVFYSFSASDNITRAFNGIHNVSLKGKKPSVL